MAITATFTADFSSFQSAVAKADVQLKSFEGGAGKVESSLNKMANSLSGTRLVQDATLMSEAVDRVGGVSKLTESELARVSAQAREAADKLVRMGQDVPPGIQKIADATKGVGSSLGGMKDMLASTAGAFGLAFSVGSVVAFGKSVFDSAGKIHDLAEQMGISTDAVQGFKSTAEQAGSSLDAVGSAIGKMNNNLAGGDKATVQALKDAGLSFQQIRNMKPEDAFLTIADAIQKMEDPMKQVEVGRKLMGKGFDELLPAIKEGFRATAAGADKMSKDTIDSLEAAGDAWQKLANKVTIVTGTLISKAMGAATSVTSSWSGFANWAENVVKFGVGPAAAMAAALDEATKAAAKNRDVNLTLPPVHHKTAEELAAEEAARKKATEAAERYAEVVREVNAASIPLTLQQKEQIVSLEKLGVSVGTIGKYLQLTEAPIGKFNDALKEQAKSIAEIGKQIDKLPHNVKLRLETTNLSSAVPMIDVDAVRKASGAVQQISDATFGDIEGRMKKMGVVTASELERLARVAREQFDSMKASGLFTVDELSAAWDRYKTAADKAAGKTHDVWKALGDLSQSLAQLSQVSGGAFSGITRDLGTIVSSMDTAHNSVKSFQEGLKGFKAGDLLSGIAGMSTGIMGIASAAIAATKAIVSLFDRSKGRDAVESFADTFGGFDALHVELNALGDEGEKLWIALTQGVGKNNPAQAQAAIDAITKALEKKKDAVGESAVATEAEAQATIETAAAAATALDDVNDRLKVNSEAWSEWSEDVTGYLQKLADDIRAMPLPLPLPDGVSAGASTGGAGASELYRGRAVMPGSAANITVISQLDGKEIARSQAKYLPGVLAGAGR